MSTSTNACSQHKIDLRRDVWLAGRRGWSRAATIALLALGLSACEGLKKAPDGRGLLPPPPNGELTSVGATPAKPFVERIGEATFARTVFATAGPSGTKIEIRDTVIGPRTEGRFGPVPGPVVFDLRSGIGSARTENKELEFSFQHPVSFPAQAAITLKNTGDVPLVLRVYLLEGK